MTETFERFQHTVIPKHVSQPKKQEVATAPTDDKVKVRGSFQRPRSGPRKENLSVTPVR